MQYNSIDAASVNINSKKKLKMSVVHVRIMYFKLAFFLFLCGIYMCSANPVREPETFALRDDKSSREAVLNEIKDDPIVSSSDDKNVFDRIAKINAKKRGSGKGFLFEGDIKMRKSDAENILQDNKKLREIRGLIKNKQLLWRGSVAYVIDSRLDKVKDIIRGAIKEFEETLTCLSRWQEFTEKERKPRDYIYFTVGEGCSSNVGRVGGVQEISLDRGCQEHGTVVHEIGHAMGLWHEQNRLDRDKYVTILWRNIESGKEVEFQKHTSERLDSLGVEYDYDSVMHYGRNAFAINPDLPTIESKPPGKKFGMGEKLSPLDKKQLRLLYGCTSGCQANLQPGSNCEYWKGLGYCQKTYVEYMKINCCKTCNQATCTDKDTRGYCPTWKQYGYCGHSSKYYAYMTKKCAKTCGVC